MLAIRSAIAAMLCEKNRQRALECASLLTVVDSSDHIQVPELLLPLGSGEGIIRIKVAARYSNG